MDCLSAWPVYKLEIQEMEKSEQLKIKTFPTSYIILLHSSVSAPFSGRLLLFPHHCSMPFILMLAYCICLCVFQLAKTTDVENNPWLQRHDDMEMHYNLRASAD